MADQDNITIALKSEASRKRRRALRLLAAVAALAIGGTAKAQEDHAGMYYARAEMAGMLGRASGQCPASSYDTKAMKIASAQLLVSIMYVVDPPAQAQRLSWGQDGAGRFNAQAAQSGLGAACDTAMGLVEKAREAIAADQQ
jgi:hypothetical protein